jgi:hypothetical protein
MPITPYTGAFGRPELLHLLRRSLFGVSPADLSHFEGMPLQQVVTELLTFSTATTPPLKNYWGLNGNTPDPSMVDPTVPFGSTWVDTPIDPAEAIDPSFNRNYSYMAWWVGNMTGQERNLREKMTLYWSNHLVTQVFAVFTPDAIYRYNQYLRDNCLGNFRQMLYDVTVHPAMLIYLNGFLNLNDAPDENYARELMELFTLGQGSGYTENDVQQAAKVLTGWTTKYSINGNPVLCTVVFTPSDHDTTNKQFSPFFNNTVIQGQTGPSGGANEINALLDMICAKPTVSKFVCRELYRFFVHGDIDATVEADVIEPLSQLFRDNAGSADQMGIVMLALLTSDHFFTADIRGCRIKSPADLLIGSVRTFGMPMPEEALVEARYHLWNSIYTMVESAGQSIADPPNVAGWPAYYLYPTYDRAWMDTASYPARRKKLLELNDTGLATPDTLYDPACRDLEFRFDFVAFVQQFSDPADPDVLINEAVELLFAVPLSPAVKDQLKTNFLLSGQSADHYWTDAFETYVADPGTTDPAAQMVPTILETLFADMLGAAEHHLH